MPAPSPFPVPDPNNTTLGELNPAFGPAGSNGGVSPGHIVAVSEKSLTSNVALLVVGAHPFAVGDSVLVNIGDAIYDGVQTLTAVTSTSVSFAKTHADVVGGPYTITNKLLASFVGTLTMAATTGLAVGDLVTVSGLSGFNGTYVIKSLTGTTISFRIYAADVGTAAASGTITRIGPLRGTVESNLAYDAAFVVPEAVLPQQPAANQALPNTDTGGMG
jgi:hypothetical protein